jgi:hypothetical protein
MTAATELVVHAHELAEEVDALLKKIEAYEALIKKPVTVEKEGEQHERG